MPAPTTMTPGLVRYQSISLLVVLGSALDTIATADFVTVFGLGTTSGQSSLKNFFATVFVNSAAAEQAFRAFGGRLTARPTAALQATDILTYTWTCTGATPTLVIAGAQAAFGQTIELVISAPHTIIQ